MTSLHRVDVAASKNQPLLLTSALQLSSAMAIRDKDDAEKNAEEKLIYYQTLRPQGGLVVISDLYQEEY